MKLKEHTFQGRSQDLAGGGQELFFSDFGICMSRRDMLRAHGGAMRLARGVRGHTPPPENFFLKWCNLVRFVVYLNQIWSLKNFKNDHFYIYIYFKIPFFYIKNKYFRYMLAKWKVVPARNSGWKKEYLYESQFAWRCVLLAQWLTWLTRDHCNPKVPSSIPAGGKDFP